MATRRYLDARFDVTDLTEEQAGQLAMEIAVQAEVSDLHPGVEPPEIEWNEVEEEEPVEEVVRAALERAHDRSELKLPDADLEVYEEEVVRALKGEKPRDLVANVIFDDAFGLAPVLAEATHGVERDGSTWFDPYLRLFDEGVPGDLPLFLMYGDKDGGTFYAPECGDVAELERRLTRAFGDAGWTIDDHDEAVQVGGAASLDCACGAGPFDSAAAVARHAAQWHPGRAS